MIPPLMITGLARGPPEYRVVVSEYLVLTEEYLLKYKVVEIIN